MLSGADALAAALRGARIKRAWSFPGGPLARVIATLEMQKNGPIHRVSVNEAVATSLALGGALLGGQNTCALLRHTGINGALEALSTFGVTNELRSGCLIVEGLDPGPRDLQNAQDNRSVLADVAMMAQLEAGTPDEAYHLARLGTLVSLRAGMPVALRVGPRALEAKANVVDLPPDLPDTAVSWARGAGPFVCTAATYRYHAEKRTRRLEQLQPVVEALVSQNGNERGPGVIVAGHLGARAQARSWARRLPTLRLGAAWPLPRNSLIAFLKGRPQVLVLEEGQPFLERALQVFCHREGITCKVQGVGGPRPILLDDDRLENLLIRFGGRVKAEVDQKPRDSAAWKRLNDAANAIGADDGEPWPLFYARTRGSMKGYAANDQRLNLLKALRGLERPTMIAGGPGGLGVLALRDKLIDVKMHMGSAAPVAGALADATEMEERAGGGQPLAVALLSDIGHYHSEINGVLDNAIARREVLHVIVVHRRDGGHKLPGLADDALETQLRSAGLHVATAQLDDPGLGAAVAYAASRSGPRALVCYAPAALADGDADG